MGSFVTFSHPACQVSGLHADVQGTPASQAGPLPPVLRRRMTSVRCKIRHILGDYNADRKDLFSANCGPTDLKQVKLSSGTS